MAFEMAQQLHGQGQRVALLAMMDAFVPPRGLLPYGLRYFCRKVWQGLGEGLRVAGRGVGRLARVIWRFAARFERRVIRRGVRLLFYHLPRMLTMSPSRQAKYTRERMAAVKKERASRSAQRAQESRGEEPERDYAVELSNFSLALDEANMRASRTYAAKPTAVPVTLFVAPGTRVKKTSDGRSGWKELAAGGIEVYETPGDHQYILKEPHVRLLAEQLRECIEKASGAAATTASPSATP